jgi:protein TonB
MTRPHRWLLLGILVSLLLHALPFLPELLSTPEKAQRPPALTASLRPPPAPVQQVPLSLPEKPPAKAPAATPKPQVKAQEKPATTAKTWTQAIRQHLKKLDEDQQFYPEEARRQGLQGTVEVLLIIDTNGNVSAARVEESSGHRMLDEAALRAVRSLRSLPADAPQQSVIPVRFRLR